MRLRASLISIPLLLVVGCSDTRRDVVDARTTPQAGSTMRVAHGVDGLTVLRAVRTFSGDSGLSHSARYTHESCSFELSSPGSRPRRIDLSPFDGARSRVLLRPDLRSVLVLAQSAVATQLGKPPPVAVFEQDVLSGARRVYPQIDSAALLLPDSGSGEVLVLSDDGWRVLTVNGIEAVSRPTVALPEEEQPDRHTDIHYVRTETHRYAVWTVRSYTCLWSLDDGTIEHVDRSIYGGVCDATTLDGRLVFMFRAGSASRYGACEISPDGSRSWLRSDPQEVTSQRYVGYDAASRRIIVADYMSGEPSLIAMRPVSTQGAAGTDRTPQ